jgi:hypothetical protein
MFKEYIALQLYLDKPYNSYALKVDDQFTSTMLSCISVTDIWTSTRAMIAVGYIPFEPRKKNYSQIIRLQKSYKFLPQVGWTCKSTP